jgi:hypothetical protein
MLIFGYCLNGYPVQTIFMYVTCHGHVSLKQIELFLGHK